MLQKRLIGLSLAALLAAGVLPMRTASAEEQLMSDAEGNFLVEGEDINSIEEVTDTDITEEEIKAYGLVQDQNFPWVQVGGYYFSSLNEALQALESGFVYYKSDKNPTGTPYTSESEGFQYWLEEDAMQYGDTVIIKLQSSGNQAIEHVIENDLNITRNIEIQHSRGGNDANKITFKGNITVKNNSSLTLITETGSATPFGIPELIFEKSVEVEEGSTLVLDTLNGADGRNPSKITYNGNGTFLTIAEGAEATIYGFEITSASSDPLIKTDGELQITFEDKKNIESSVSTAGTVFEIGSTGTMDIKGGSYLTSGSDPAIVVKDGASLTLTGGEVKSESTDGPAIVVESNATITIPTDSTTSVTTADESQKAIDLAEESTIKKGDTTIAVSETSGDEDSYVDNYGNLVLAQGATVEGTDGALNSSVILPDGTIISGTADKKPVIEYKNDSSTIYVPAGSTVTKPGEESVTVNKDSIVTEDGDVEEIKEISIKPEASTLYVNGTTTISVYGVDNAQLTDVSWASSNPSVATVDENGFVTAVSAGTATITYNVTINGVEYSTYCIITVKEKTTPSTNGGSSTSSSKVSAVTTADGDKVKVKETTTDKEVKALLEKDEIVATIQLSKVNEEVTVTYKGGKKYANKDIYVVMYDEEAKQLILIDQIQADRKGIIEFDTLSEAKLTLTTKLPEGFITAANDELQNRVTYYVLADGTFRKGWLEIDGAWYFFDYQSGVMAYDTWKAEWSDWYVFGKDGKMLTNTWIATSNKRWYYVGNDGKMVRNVTVDGCWINGDGIYYSQYEQ